MTYCHLSACTLGYSGVLHDFSLLVWLEPSSEFVSVPSWPHTLPLIPAVPRIPLEIPRALSAASTHFLMANSCVFPGVLLRAL